MTKFVFINPYEYSYLGTRVLSAYLQKHGFMTHNILLNDLKYKVVDMPSEEYDSYHFYMGGNVTEALSKHNPLSNKDLCCLEKILEEEKPDIIGFSSRSTYNYIIPHLVPVFKKVVPNALLAAGGYGPTLQPEIYLEAGFDVVVRGDGEEAVLELAQCVDKKDFISIVNIQNTYWSEKWGGRRNLLRDQEKNLSKYCEPLRGDKHFSYIDDGELYRNCDPILKREKYFTYFGRGCIGKCSYCSGGQWSNLYKEQGKKAYKRRNRKIEEIIAEVKSLPEYINMLVFTDEYFALSKEQCKEFFTLYKENCSIPFWAYLDYGQMIHNPDLFELVLDAGLSATGIGFQTGSGSFAEKYYNRKQDFDLLIEYANMLFNNHIFINPQFIGGNCYETIDDLHQTIDIVRKLPFSIESPFRVYLQSTQLKPHPKTPLTLIAPKVVNEPMSSKEWFYRAILVELSRITSKEQLSEIMNNKMYKDNPALLNKFFKESLCTLQCEHYTRLVDENKNDEWIFYGPGFAYHKNKRFFERLNPKAILIDKAFYHGEKMIDGIPVIVSEDFFSEHNRQECKFMIFTSKSYNIAKKLLRIYNIPFDNIHSCTSNWLSPFCAE